MGLAENRVAIVTGAAQGIGRAVAMKLACEGADIVVVDTKLESAAEVAKEVEVLGRKALAVKCNVSDMRDVMSLAQKVQEVFPKVDILVNNAGITRDNLMLRMDENDWDLVMSVNL